MTILADATTAESQIFNAVVELLVRQRQESVTEALLELKAQLGTIYGRKGNDAATCQMGLGLISLGLGDHAEAERFIGNALKIAAGEEYVAGNGLLAYVNMGNLMRAHDLALESSRRFAGSPLVLKQVSHVLEETLDFAAAADSIEAQLKLKPDAVHSTQLATRQTLLRQLSARAESLNLTAKDLIGRAEFAAGRLKDSGHKIFLVALRGTHVNSVTLEFYVDASPDDCAELNYVVAEALFDRFDDATGVELVPISVRSFAGRQPAEHAHQRKEHE